MRQLALDRLRQRAEYTHKFNRGAGRHGWLRLTPAYSVRIVDEIMGRTQGHLRVLDPFCGTATTALSAAYHGHTSVTTDINPFLVWLGRAKTAHYTADAVARALDACAEALALVEAGTVDPVPPPPIHNIERWWAPPALAFLCQLKAAIDKTVSRETPDGMLLQVAFCRTLIASSNAAFNHQSMSFKDNQQQLRLDLQPDFSELFRRDVIFVARGALENPTGEASVILHDARELAQLGGEPFDLVVTSPPYANRMSYIRELRPYMYWLRFLENSRDAGELDWLAIGGTWGVATSRLADWQPEKSTCLSQELEETLTRIADPNNANGVLLATYVRKYFVDITKHIAGLRRVLAAEARLHYIVGNSTFYGVLLPVERFYAHIMAELGFSDIEIRPLRKRNSKRELVEFDVSARWR